MNKKYPSSDHTRHSIQVICLALLFFSFLTVLGCTPSSDKTLAEAEHAYAQGDYNRALALSDGLLQKVPDSFPAHRIKALSYVAQGSIETAFNGLEGVETRYPAMATPLLKEIAIGIIKLSLSHENLFVRSAAIKAVGEMGDLKLSALIIPGLKDSQTFVRFFAVESIGLLGGPDALKLFMAAGNDPDGMVRVGAVKAIDDMAEENNKSGKQDGAALNQLLATFTDDGDITVQLFSLAAMAKWGDQEASQNMLKIIRGLTSNERFAGAAALGRSKKSEAVPLLVDFITDPEESLRMYAAEAMGDIASGDIYDPLVKALSDPASSVRAAAATSLGKLGDKRAIPHLSKLLKDTDAVTRVSVAEGLHYLGQERFSIFRDAMTEEDYAIRHFTIGSLRRTGGEKALRLLSMAMQDTAPRVRIATIRALGEIGGINVLPLLREGMKDPDLAVRTYAAGNVGRLLNKASGASLKKTSTE
ncbi:MAG: HEAT repeat domain-containing protein [Nitrospira sp.]|nr:HEAT repeat domain-containing protein [Candidatus Manganitrophaceae bacterium]HIL34775.1 HEAT repeat domain-containing protein [Candidatus Manganitrophaceae bacterium]